MKSIDNNSTTGDTKKKIEEILAKHDIKLNAIKENRHIKYDKTVNNFNENDKEIAVSFSLNSHTSLITTKLDTKGIIEYINNSYAELSGYEQYEVVGQKFDSIKHPDMPKVIMETLWRNLKNGENNFTIFKNLNKIGNIYWTVAKFIINFDKQGQINSFQVQEKLIPPASNSIILIEKLYKTLKGIELHKSLDTSTRYFYGMLEERQMSYSDYINHILQADNINLKTFFVSSKDKTQAKKVNVLKRIFGK